MKTKLQSILAALIPLQLITCNLFCQQQKDTIYFDEDWSICEQPVAAFYRVCTLNREKTIFYKGDVENYYSDGQLEMKGHYNDEGFKDGSFTFYNQAGKILKQGNYVNNEMNGGWLYYDSTGNLKLKIFCRSSSDFTPLLIINKNNDTLLKNGNGKFSFNTKKDLPGIFADDEYYFVEGEVVNNLKTGTFNYYTSEQKDKPVFSELYKNDKFIKGTSYNAEIYEHLQPLHLSDYILDKTDEFNHSNMVFGQGAQGDQKVINFLLYNIPPQIAFNSKNFSDNDRIIFEIIGNVLRKSLRNSSNTRVTYNNSPQAKFNMYYSFITDKTARDVKGRIAITIDTSGNIIQSAFETNLDKKEINEIDYYFSRITGLKPQETEGKKTLGNMNIKLSSASKNFGDKTKYVYEVYNTDSVNTENVASFNSQNMDTSMVQIEAKFPGGQDAWRKYLERNLNSSVAANHNAPVGYYTVTVSFLVDKEGNISEVHALTDPGYGTAEEAIRVIKKGPKWMPAIQYGKNVIYRQKQNFTFQVTQ